MRTILLCSLWLALIIPVQAQLGDLNGDQQVGPADQDLLDQYLQGTGLLSEQQLQRADLNGDRRVDSQDSVLLSRPQAIAVTPPTPPAPAKNWSQEGPTRAWPPGSLPLAVFVEKVPAPYDRAQAEYEQVVRSALQTWNDTGIQGKPIFIQTPTASAARVRITWSANEKLNVAGFESPRLVSPLPGSQFWQILGSEITIQVLHLKRRVIPTSLLGFVLPIPMMDIPLENVEQKPPADLHGLLVHELGHTLGLGHNDNSEDIMYPQEAGGLIVLGFEFRAGQGLTQTTKTELARHYAAAWTDQARPLATPPRPAMTRVPERPVAPPEDIWDAAIQGQTAQVEQLLAQGIAVNARNLRGWTPLMAAVVGGYPAMVKLLLARGASPDLADNQGNTARQYAQMGANAEIRQLLGTGKRG
ncbi:ankyrin repeat domain-containing protein [Candidatus Cyanaurora vandensis]|uniref:ankyrin repeat domain-containing protein n=1 Tax=Candidatus Cyanaurora vandensis TaxID=2714958 RepID=UPI002580D8F8|nr:ankyrin repeat domain-containing protein [Candidatus Cyanaurora vandensis]